MVEIWQRMDLEYEAFVYITTQRERDHWEYNIAGSSTEEKQEEAIRKLKGEYDAIVLIDFVVGWLPEEAQDLLRSKVEAGCGLILANKSDDFRWPLEAVPDSTGFMKGVPLTQIPPSGERRAPLGKRCPPGTGSRPRSAAPTGWARAGLPASTPGATASSRRTRPTSNTAVPSTSGRCSG